MKRLGLYLHVPFCRSKCLYCDFCSLPHRSEEMMTAYVAQLTQDLIASAARCKEYEVDTVYVGGGTPTALPEPLLCGLLETVHSHFRVCADAEVTVECNPVTESRALFTALRVSGANRLSVGLQSIHKAELRGLGRLHDYETFVQTLADARAAGFENIGVDLMMGIPGQTAESYLATLDAVTRLAPTHISAYGLIVEEDTPFGRMGSKLILPDEEIERAMYFRGKELLEARGYAQYEISNFARTGYRSRHNLKYWHCEEYLGLGVAAHSDLGESRFGFARDVDAYLRGERLYEERRKVTPIERKNEYVMLSMRLSEGVRADGYAQRTGGDLDADFADRFAPYVKMGLVKQNEQGYAFTPEGMYVSNAILCEVLLPEDA